MKSYFFIVSFFLIFKLSNSLDAQWSFGNTGTGFSLWGVFFANQSTGWACGNQGGEILIINSTNGGENWHSQYYVSNNHYLISVMFADQNTGWVVGGNDNCYNCGIVLKTTNAGANWFTQYINDSTYGSLYAVYFINQNTGWASYSKIIKTTNGGSNWSIQYQIPNSFILSIHFLDQSTGWAVGFNSAPSVTSLILKTTNGGTNWMNQMSPVNDGLSSVHFANMITGWAVGARDIIKTTNGGASWFTQFSGVNEILNSVYFINQFTGWIVGSSDRKLKTTNGGSNWYPQVLNAGRTLSSVYFIDQNYGWIAGTSGTIERTTNGGGPIGIKPISGNVPEFYVLYQNYPNPFNSTTTIRFELPRRSSVSIIVYDILGRELSKLVQGKLNQGIYETSWDGTDFPSGVYLYKLLTDEYSETRKIVLNK